MQAEINFDATKTVRLIYRKESQFFVLYGKIEV